MSEREQAMKRLRAVLMAQNALSIALAEATADAFAQEPPPSSTERPAHRSGLRPSVKATQAATPLARRFENLDEERRTRPMMRRLSSADIERHLAEKWARATSEDERECVRAMIASTADSGVLDADAAERLRALVA